MTVSRVARRIFFLGMTWLTWDGVGPGGLFLPNAFAQAQKPESEFTRLAGRLAGQRLAEAEEGEKLQEQALAILDGLVFEALNAGSHPDLDAVNQRLAGLVRQPPAVGESYRLVSLGGSPDVYALVANFSLGGPSAVRLYRSVASRYGLAARVDRFAQKDFFDEYLEVVPVPGPKPGLAVLFVTVTGRTDELQTGAFTAWRFGGDTVKALWSSDILQQSSYELRPEGFRLTYCAETDENSPSLCRRMTRDLYTWDGAVWKRVEQASVPVPKR